MSRMFLAVTATLLVAVAGLSFRAAPHNGTVAIVAERATPKDVDAEKTKIANLAKGLSAMLGSQGGTLSHSKVAPALKLFLGNLVNVLKEVDTVSTPADAMRKLLAAKAGVSGLVSELTSQQEALMKEDASQKESLLLGVLLTRQKEPMEKQLEVLRNSDFAGLDVARELLQNHSTAVALYAQAAAYLDKHHAIGHNSGSVSVVGRVDAMASSLDRRVAALEHEADTRARHHKSKMDQITQRLQKDADAKNQRVLKMSLKREEHEYNKWAALRRHDIDSMKAAAQAVRSGDVQALRRAKSALEKSLESLKGHSSGFLVFLAMGHQLLQRDCPYCAAQCVEACHNRGESFTSCLGECADAGKSL